MKHWEVRCQPRYMSWRSKAQIQLHFHLLQIPLFVSDLPRPEYNILQVVQIRTQKVKHLAGSLKLGHESTFSSLDPCSSLCLPYPHPQRTNRHWQNTL
jgi:hypothetical protein